MNDGRPTDEADQEWLAELLDNPAAAVESLEQTVERGTAGIRCEYLEVLGMLPLALEERAAPEALKDRILGAAETASRASEGATAAAPEGALLSAASGPRRAAPGAPAGRR